MELPPLDYASPLPPGQAKRKPMLAWWGVIPLVVFALVELVSSWQVARARGRAVDYTVGYVTGSVFTAILISLFFAWVTSLLSRRSQLASTIVFTVFMSLFAMSGLSMMVVQMQRSVRFSGTVTAGPLGTNPLMAPTPPPAPPVRVFPVAGIQVDGPSGWHQMPPDRAGIVTQWIGPNSQPGDVRRAILIEVAKARGDALQAATAIAVKWGGQVVNDHMKIDGEDACLVQTQQTKPTIQLVEALVTVHQGSLYAAQGAVMPGQTCDAELEKVRESWKWIPMVSPSQHLDYWPHALTMFDGKYVINYPVEMQTIKSSKPGELFGLALYSPKLNNAEFGAVVELVPTKSGATFADTENEVATNVRVKYHISDPYIWRLVSGSGMRAITQPIRTTIAGRTCLCACGLVSLDKSNSVAIQFQVYADDPSDQAAYMAAAEKILGSVEPGPNRPAGSGNP